MRMRQTDEEKSRLRLSRAVIAAGAAVTTAVAVSAYAVYRAQGVVRGLKENYETTTSLYSNPSETILAAEKE